MQMKVVGLVVAVLLSVGQGLTPLSAVESSTVDAATSESLVSFVERFKTAFEGRDLNLAENLFFWEGLNAADR
ncbi:MAG: hypothetical protein CMO26_18400 [Thiotrichales bacterium]|nr:hypothetical protein [Thiotrichales bacterium]|tara:strand:+ start:216 stop:434 length:219 start_codon:yes stop_codon:yes gene_type:complete